MFYRNSHERIKTKSRVPVFIIYFLKQYNNKSRSMLGIRQFVPSLKNISNSIRKAKNAGYPLASVSS